jgi:hypothetical protein
MPVPLSPRHRGWGTPNAATRGLRSTIAIVRQWVTPRSLLLHLAFVVIASGCLIAAWWQVHRAMQGNTLSYLYSVEWPAFAVVAGIGWWQMFHDTPEDLAERKAHHARARAASAEVVARTLPRSALAITVDSDDAGAGRRLGPGSRFSELTTGQTDSGTPLPELAWARSPAVPEGGDADLLAEEDQPTDELTAYNRYLALLAVRGKAKTWRNPHGIS